MAERDSCPYCATRSLELRKSETAIPYFGRVLILASICSDCGYRRNDTMPLEDHGPSRHVIKVSKLDDLRIKVARSGTGSIEIPEFGLRLDPRDESQSFITNIEEILVRFEESVNRLKKLGRTSKMAECNKLLHEISLARQGKARFTIVIEDTQGNSSVTKEDRILRSSLVSSKEYSGIIVAYAR
nr:ZPR1 zinc finger domain-containing protein [Candidatus Njordarchaeum guaymaensis]